MVCDVPEKLESVCKQDSTKLWQEAHEEMRSVWRPTGTVKQRRWQLSSTNSEQPFESALWGSAMSGAVWNNRIEYRHLRLCAESWKADAWLAAFLQELRPFVRGISIGMGQLSLTELSDAALIKVCQQRGTRDDRPFQELFRRYHSVVWRVCYSYMRNREDAEDLIQDVFFKVYRNLHQFEGRSSFKTWLYRVTINTCQNEIRRRGRRPQEAETEMEAIAEVIPSGQSVEKVYQAEQRRQLLAEALASLDPGISEILYMKDMEERPYNEIADLLDIGVSAAKMRVQRARLALQVQYRLLDGDS